MKLQNLLIIFVAIALPVILILSVFVQLQVDTASLRARYNDYLVNAAHETIMAFQINTDNDKYSDVPDKKAKDIEASLNIFSSTMATSLGMTGASKSRVMAYVPALVFSLYDGYYIYMPTERTWNGKNWDEVTLTHELKSYVYYSKTYKNNMQNKILTINYSLDNYVVLYYADNVNNKYESVSGYLEIEPAEVEKINYYGTDETAKKYYEGAWAFTKKFNDIIKDLDSSEANNLIIQKGIGTQKENSALPDAISAFNDEKHEVIKDSINKNLIQAMHVYGFEMPMLTEEDWDLILNNICFTAFMQGMPLGTSKYNNYTIAVSSENTEMVNPSDIYYVNRDASRTNSPVHIIEYHVNT